MTTAVASPVRMVHSLPAAAHIRALRYTGLNDREITTRARLTTNQLRRAARGDLIGWDVERRILRVTIPNVAVLKGTVTGPGTRRRLRALVALGWPLEHLAAALGWPLGKVQRAVLDTNTVTRADYLLVCALYDQRWAWAPEDHGVPADEAAAARETARISNCYSPLAWDDEIIDVPKGRPNAGRTEVVCLDTAAAVRAVTGDPVPVPTGQARTHAIAYGARYLDLPWDLMAERLSMNPESLRRSWERIKDRVRADANGKTTWVDAPRFTDAAFIKAWDKGRAAA
ncbi:hypothetical protein EDD90_2830 [Streptomyces sp. Ag109_O5-1]|uniref:hypothetical protein n=1 Tax=Streptomyces sp. Ag109_O5-1 TaxID=1938851 RepID=UPI000F4DD0A9|nr:hypothetical protein [Streptomyces sp. Ag109_O5-1]RPE39812.1 hypothetical protein EDD90_2830 [Streptomyces sp. Ag109_O5-1]